MPPAPAPPRPEEHAVSWEVSDRPLSDREVRRALDAALAHGGRPAWRLSVVLVDDATLAELHGRTLGDPAVTDVLSFELGEQGPGPAGEVFASVERARLVAAERGVPVGRELALYLVHGVLHLCGWDDHAPADRARMRAAERAVLDGLGYPPDEAPHDALDEAPHEAPHEALDEADGGPPGGPR